MNYVTYGGVTVGLCILMYQVVTWWPGRKALMKDPVKHASRLLPFVASWCYGCLTTLGVGGLVATAASAALGLSNWLGDVALVWGVGGNIGDLAAAPFVPLTGPGRALMLILTVVVIAAAKKFGSGSEIKRGAWCGVCLGTSSGVAGFAAVPLAQGANWLGDSVYGAF